MNNCRIYFILLFALIINYSPSYSQKNSSQYEALKNRIAKGWNTWSYGSMLTQVLLPEGLSVKINFRNSGIGTPYDPNYFLDDITIDKSGLFRPIAHTFDGAYTELIIDNWYGNSIRVQSAASGEDLVLLVTPIKSSSNNHYDVELQTGFMWNREGYIKRGGETITANAKGEKFLIGATQKVLKTFHTYTSPYFSCKGDTTVGFYVGDKKTLTEIKSIIAAAKTEYDKKATTYKDMAEAFKGIESVLGWNTLYDAYQNRVITPVTRGWNEAWQGFVLFEWDTYFASFLFALDNKDLAYSNAIAVTKGVNKQGAVGFTQMPGNGISEQSQPPVGSMICWLIYEKYHEKWFLEEVYKQLLSWNQWWIKNRLNKNYLTWGGPLQIGNKKNVILESGLDNSPMYEDITPEVVGNNSLMNLADVGLNSLYVADCKYLAKIAKELGKTKDEIELLGRARKYSTLTAMLWDDKTGIYLNKYLDTFKFSPRLSPTLFYPMLAGIPSKLQSDRMMAAHYYNSNEFYGDYIIPSCPRNDKSFNNDYWRGAIWGPMNFLVYMGLRDYNKKAAKELADKSYDLFLKAWNKHHYVFENINSVKGVSDKADNQLDCDPYYHWGALMGIMKFMEENKY